MAAPGEGTAPITGAGRQLFPWVLAKAFLSSPAALVETVEARQKTLSRKGELHGDEGAALARLGGLAAATQDAGSAKLDALVAHLRRSVSAPAATRVVLFSERVATLNWLRAELPRRLNCPTPPSPSCTAGCPTSNRWASSRSSSARPRRSAC